MGLFCRPRFGRTFKILLLIKILITVCVIYSRRSKSDAGEVDTFSNDGNSNMAGRSFLNISDLPLRNYPDRSQFGVRNFAVDAYVYSAFVDLRQGNMGYPNIRMLAVLRSLGGSKQFQFICHFNDSNGRKSSSSVSYYQMAENHGKRYKMHFMSCPIPDENLIRPWNLKSLVLEQKSNGNTNEIQISNILLDDYRSVDHKFEYSVCVPTIFGDRYSPKYLVEFIEINRLLGAQHFFFYLAPDSIERYRPVLDFYHLRGIATYFVFEFPFTNHIWNYGQSLVANDCVYRNAGRSKFVLLHDLDEYFVPYSAYTWADLFDQNGLWSLKNESVAAFGIQTRYFDTKDFGSSSPNLTFVENHLISSDRVDSRLTKCIVRPERIFEQGIHHVSRVVQDYYTVVRMDKELGSLHHYKRRPLWIPVENRKLVELIERNEGFRERLKRVVDELKL